MSEALVPDFPSLLYTEALTGGTVRGGHTITRATAVNIVATGRPARRVGPMQTQTVAAAQTFVAGYTRSHDSIKQLWLGWFYRPAGLDTLATVAVTLTITDALGNTVASSSDLIPLGFKGVASQPIAATHLYQSDSLLGGSGYLDLDAVAAVLTDPSWSFSFAWACSDVYTPLDRIEGWECPRSQVDSADTYGALTGPVNPGNPVLAGSITTTGYERIAQTVAGAILAGRTLLSVAWPTDATIAPGLTSATFVPFTRMLEGGATPWSWRVRPRVVYAPSSAVGEPHRVRYLYRVTGGGSGTIRCTATSVGAGSVTTADAALLTSATFAWSGWVSTTIPTDGTDRIVALTFTGKTTAGTLSVAAIEVEEYQ
jgi:hypothetical protein